MDRSEYENLKRRAESVFREAQEKYQQDLAAIDRVWAIAQTNGVPSPPGAVSVPQQNRTIVRPKGRPRGRKSAYIQDVRQAIQSINGNFDFRDIFRRLAVEKPGLRVQTGTLKVILKKLIGAGEIEVVSQGIGRRATRYRRK